MKRVCARISIFTHATILAAELHAPIPRASTVTVSNTCTHNDDEADELCVRPFPALPGDDVPLLRRADDHLRPRNLLFVQLVVSGQLVHRYTVGA